MVQHTARINHVKCTSCKRHREYGCLDEVQKGIHAVMPTRLPHREAQIKSNCICARILVRQISGDPKTASDLQEVACSRLSQCRSNLVQEAALVIIVVHLPDD